VETKNQRFSNFYFFIFIFIFIFLLPGIWSDLEERQLQDAVTELENQGKFADSAGVWDYISKFIPTRTATQCRVKLVPKKLFI